MQTLEELVIVQFTSDVPNEEERDEANSGKRTSSNTLAAPEGIDTVRKYIKKLYCLDNRVVAIYSIENKVEMFRKK